MGVCWRRISADQTRSRTSWVGQEAVLVHIRPRDTDLPGHRSQDPSALGEAGAAWRLGHVCRSAPGQCPVVMPASVNFKAPGEGGKITSKHRCAEPTMPATARVGRVGQQVFSGSASPRGLLPGSLWRLTRHVDQPLAQLEAINYPDIDMV